MTDREEKFRELAEKHNVELTMPIHDEVHVTGKKENVISFFAEYQRWLMENYPIKLPDKPILLEVELPLKEW